MPRPAPSLQTSPDLATPYQACTEALRTTGRISIDASEFSADELEAAAHTANQQQALLFIHNLRGKTLAEIRRITEAGGRRIYFDDVSLI